MSARPRREVVKVGLSAMDDDPAAFSDVLCATEAEQARTVGVSVATWRELKRDRPPLSLFRSDLTRYGVALNAGLK